MGGSKIPDSRTAGVGSVGLETDSRLDWQRRFRLLFNLQHWLWGCDVRHPRGNLLLDWGLRRVPVPPDCRAPSLYLAELQGGLTVFLRGFGTVIASPEVGGIFLSRYLPQPEWMPTFDCETLPFVPAQLPHRRSPSSLETDQIRHLLVRFFDWIADWERTALTHLGPADRDGSILAWSPRGAEVTAASLPETWEQLARALEQSAPATLGWIASAGQRSINDAEVA